MTRSHRYKTLLFALIVCLIPVAVSACLLPPTARESVTDLKLSTTSPPSNDTELIAYRAQLDGKDFIRLVRPETLVETTVYTSNSIVQSPILSPDAGLLSFAEWSGEDNLFNFWIMGRNGANLRQVAAGVQVESLIAQGKWSFDEQLLAYRASFDPQEPSEAKMFVIDVTTSEIICEVSNVWAFEWSPVENMIAYIPWQDQQVGINLVKVDGCDSQSILLFNDQLTSFNPTLSWSPDGKQVAFAGRAVQQSLTEIILVDIQRSEQRELTNAAANNYTSREIHDLEWSPDGEYILFRSTYEQPGDSTKTRNDLFIVKVDTSQEQKLAERVSYPVWSPDSEAIAFVTQSDDEENEQIHKVEISTGNITKLVDTPGNKEFLSWR